LSVNPPSLETATKVELEVHKGKDITWEMTVVNIQDGLPVDITGATIIFSVKENIEDTTAEFIRTVGGGIVIDSDQVTNKGKFQLSLVPSNTNTLEIKPYECDIEITLGGKEQTPTRGTLQILSVVGV
jgi:hypothetical protein